MQKTGMGVSLAVFRFYEELYRVSTPGTFYIAILFYAKHTVLLFLHCGLIPCV